jgi:hypothetical protein
VAVGLILALAVDDMISGVDLTAVGWILAAVGVAVIALQAITLNRGRNQRTVAKTTHRDGSQSVEEREHYGA